MLPEQTMAMMRGMDSGQQQAQSLLPSVYQPKGKAKATNPWEGALDMVCDQILQIAAGVDKQGGDYRDLTQALYKACYDIKKVNNQITTIAQGESEDV